MSDQFFYLLNMEAQEGQNAKENEKLHVPTWNKVKKRKNCIKTGWTLVLKDEEFPQNLYNRVRNLNFLKNWSYISVST